MHVGIGAMMGMYLFAGIMIVLNIAAFWPAKWTIAIEPVSQYER
ncbi:MAG TPA: hypothetical protein VGI60_09965 [Chthoniobacterales bacterium]|jgi:hypothetical protein